MFVAFNSPSFALVFYLFLFGQVGSIIGCCIIENKAFISEQMRYGYATGATLRLVFYSIIFVTALSVLLTYFLKKERLQSRLLAPIQRWERVFVNIFTAVIASCLVFVVIRYGTPLSMGMDRFKFWADVAPVGKKFSGLAIQAAFLNGVLYARTSAGMKKKGYLLNLLILLFLQVLQGVKFSGLQLSGFLFFFPSLLSMTNNNNLVVILKKYFVYVMLFCGALFLIIMMQYKYLYRNNPLELMGSRVVQQGHVWWGTDCITQRFGGLPPSSILHELNPLMRVNGESLGLEALMWAVSPRQIVEVFLRKNVYFSMGYPAIIIYYLGYASSTVVQILAAWIVSLMTITLLKASIFKNAFIALIAARLYLVIIDIFLMGNIYLLVDYRVIIYTSILCIYAIVARLTSKNILKENMLVSANQSPLLMENK